MNNLIFAVIGVVALAGVGGYFAYSNGYLDYSVQEAEVMTETEAVQENSALDQVSEDAKEKVVEEPETIEEVEVVEEVEANIEGKSFTLKQAKEQVRLCDTDDDCKIIPITCNDCDCGRAVNAWTEPYACTEADKATHCPLILDCPSVKAVCNAGVCESENL